MGNLTKQSIKLGYKTTSYQYWAKELIKYSKTEQIKEEIAYWTKRNYNILLPSKFEEFSKKNYTLKDTKIVSLQLNKEKTKQLLQECNQAYNTQINDLLLSSLIEAYTEWSGHHELLINLEGHGREELFKNIDLSTLPEID